MQYSVQASKLGQQYRSFLSLSFTQWLPISEVHLDVKPPSAQQAQDMTRTPDQSHLVRTRTHMVMSKRHVSWKASLIIVIPIYEMPEWFVEEQCPCQKEAVAEIVVCMCIGQPKMDMSVIKWHPCQST